MGRYEIVYPYAQGGMASVYVGRLSGMAGFERLVAIKVIHAHLASEETFVKMFLDEARLAAGIHHPNVGEIIEVGEDDGLFFMVGDLITGQNLRSLQRRAKREGVEISHSTWAHICAQVCLALHAAHEHRGPDGELLGLVHRDVSPRNILVSYDGYVKLIDFGVALARGRITQTDAGTVKGKIGYMPPEQIQGLQMDRRSDLFSLGVVLYQLVTGHHPFPGASEGERLHKAMSGAFVWPGMIVEDIDPGLEQIILKALANDPEERFPTARAMHDELVEVARSRREGRRATDLAELMHSLFEHEYADHRQKLVEHRSRDDSSSTSLATGSSMNDSGFARRKDDQSSDDDVTSAATPRAVLQAAADGRKRPPFKLLMAGAAILVAAVVLVIVFAFAGEEDPPGPVAEVVAPVEEPETPPAAAVESESAMEDAPARVRFTLDVVPDNAEVTVNGEKVGRGLESIELPGDGSRHSVVFSAPGYRKHTETVVADADGTIEARLRRAPRARKKTAKKKGVTLKGSPYR